ncbi:MAG: hypothetical protein Q9187_004869 [Circinaria calcarea]
MLVHLISILFFLVALILAAPSSPNLHSYSKLLSKRHVLQCFQSTPTNPLCRIIPSDCMRAVQILREGDKVDAPMEFSRVTGYRVPHRLEVGTCKIIWDIIAEGNPSEITTLYEISARALELTSRCVIAPHSGRVGGRSTVGPNDLIWVGVIAVDRSDEPPRRPSRLNPMAVVNQCLAPR